MLCFCRPFTTKKHCWSSLRRSLGGSSFSVLDKFKLTCKWVVKQNNKGRDGAHCGLQLQTRTRSARRCCRQVLPPLKDQSSKLRASPGPRSGISWWSAAATSTRERAQCSCYTRRSSPLSGDSSSLFRTRGCCYLQASHDPLNFEASPSQGGEPC